MHSMNAIRLDCITDQTKSCVYLTTSGQKQFSPPLFSSLSYHHDWRMKLTERCLPRFYAQYLRHQQALFYMGNRSSEVEVDEEAEYDREEKASF